MGCTDGDIVVKQIPSISDTVMGVQFFAEYTDVDGVVIVMPQEKFVRLSGAAGRHRSFADAVEHAGSHRRSRQGGGYSAHDNIADRHGGFGTRQSGGASCGKLMITD